MKDADYCTLNQRVAGSSPATPTRKINHLRPPKLNRFMSVGTHCWEFLHRFSHLTLRDVTVFLRHRDRAVAELIADHFKRRSRLPKPGRERMSEIMPAEIIDAGDEQRLLEMLPPICGVEHIAAGARDLLQDQ